ncbi:MAG TPA: hypothetical protein VIL01_15885 [Thermomicrobiales bacterium]
MSATTSTWRDVWWVGLSIGLIGFIALARLTTYETMTERGVSSVWNVWWRLRNDLPDFGPRILMVTGYFLALLIILGGTVVAMRIALDAGPVVEEASAERQAGAADAPSLDGDRTE